MYFGVQYYRAPFPREEYWERDMKNIAGLGFNTVKLWAVWNEIEKQEGIYDYEDLDKLIEVAGENNLAVTINIIPEGAPYRLYDAYPECLYESNTGLKVTTGGPANIPTAGWPGLCMDNREIEDKVCQFIYVTAKHFGTNENVKIIDVWNEPHMEPTFDYPDEMFCVCKGSIHAFREWLLTKYETIENLNAVWLRNYESFNQIMPPPRFGTYTDMMDWRKFWLYNLAAWLRKRVAAARKGAPNKILQTHSASADYMGASSTGALGRELADEFLLAKEVDVFGLSSFPKWLMGKTAPDYNLSHLLQSEIICAAARDKPFYQVEQQGGAGVPGYLAHKQPSAEELRVWNWNTIVSGGKGVVYWQYAPEPSGCESPGFGLIDCDGNNTERSIEAGRLAREFSRYNLADKAPELAVNGIYLSRNADLLLFAANSSEEKYAHSIYGVYKAFAAEGIPVRFVHEDYLDGIGSEGLQNLYVPMALSLSEEENQGLIHFMEMGGNVFIEAGTGMYSDVGDLNRGYGLMRQTLLAGGFEMNFCDEKIAITDEEGSLVLLGNDYRQTYQSETGLIRGRFDDGRAALVEQGVGSGKITWIGSFAGLAAYEDSAVLQKFLRQNFDICGYERIKKLEARGLIVRSLISAKENYLVVTNQGDQAKSLKLELEDGELLEFTVEKYNGIIIKK